MPDVGGEKVVFCNQDLEIWKLKFKVMSFWVWDSLQPQISITKYLYRFNFQMVVADLVIKNSCSFKVRVESTLWHDHSAERIIHSPGLWHQLNNRLLGCCGFSNDVSFSFLTFSPSLPTWMPAEASWGCSVPVMADRGICRYFCMEQGCCWCAWFSRLPQCADLVSMCSKRHKGS